MKQTETPITANELDEGQREMDLSPVRKMQEMGAGDTMNEDLRKHEPNEKNLKPVTEAQKEEISEKVGLLNTKQIGRAAEITKDSLRKAGRADLAYRVDDEMEFEIDQIPGEALDELLKLVRETAPVTGGSVEG